MGFRNLNRPNGYQKRYTGFFYMFTCLFKFEKFENFIKFLLSKENNIRCKRLVFPIDAYACMQRFVAHILLVKLKPKPLKDISLAMEDPVLEKGLLL